MQFAKHLPPSFQSPRVLALDATAAAELLADGDADVTLAPDTIMSAPAEWLNAQQWDAIVGYAPPDPLTILVQLLRPGGRLILAHRAGPQALLAALTAAGLTHCLVESSGDVTLYRGERPPEGSSVERMQSLAGGGEPRLAPTLTTPFVFLLIAQTPIKPAWKLAAHDNLEWYAATVLDPATGRPELLAFSSLVKAVAFMQPAILANAIGGVNRVGKFRAGVAQTWGLPLRLDPAFDDLRPFTFGPAFSVDPQSAITSNE